MQPAWSLHLQHGEGRSPAARWLLGLSLVTASSWGRWLATGSLRIDENYPSALAGSFLVLILGLGWALAVWGWVGLLAAPPDRPRRLAYAGLAAVSLMLPLLSNDVFGLFAYAGLALRGQDVYGSTQSLPASVWFVWIGERWRENPCPYGPWALLSAGPASLAGERHPLLALFVLRLCWLVPLVAVMELALRVFRGRPDFQAMLWLNPLVLVEGVGQQHPDLLAFLAITAGLIGQSNGSRVWGALGWTGATLCKWNQGVAAPWFWLFETRTVAQRLRSGLLLVAVLGLGAIAVYLPLWRGSATLSAPFQALLTQTLVPGGSVVDVVGELGNALQGARRDVFDPRMPVVERVARQREARSAIWHGAQVVMSLLALLALLPLLARFFRPRHPDEVALATGSFVVIVLTLASPKFQSWYLMSALPFFGLTCPPAWRRWWPWVIFFAVSEEFAVTLPRDALLFAPVVGLSTGATALVFLWSFRARYWRKPESDDPAADAGSAAPVPRPAAAWRELPESSPIR